MLMVGIPVNNDEIAQVFENIADLLELKGEVVFKIRAYQRAARTIEHLPVELEQMVKEEQDLKSIPGIGDAISKKIQELVATGKLRYYEELKGEFPAGLVQLITIPGIGPKTALKLSKDLGINDAEALEQAILDGRVASLPGLGAKSAENMLRHIRSLMVKETRIPIGQALPIAEEVIVSLKKHPALHWIYPAGSLRRFRETVGDIDIMGIALDPEAVIAAFVKLPMVKEVLVQGPTKASVVVHKGLQVDLRLVEDAQFGTLLQYFTGSQQHNIRIRDRANRMGLSINEYGITNLKTGQVEHYASEEEVYHRLGLQYIPPEIREAVWEVELAEKSALPHLVELGDIRGDLHCHTEWSDGAGSIEALVDAAKAKGYQYIAITDHSAGRGVAQGLTPERLRQQIAEIREVQSRVSGIRVLAGSEVDIRADGSLDYPDELLAELDVVIGSIHSAMEQGQERMTARIIKAMHNPHVDIIGHLTARLLGERDPINVDVEAVFRAAMETGIALEINASPERLDLKDVHIYRARELGVPLVISTDAHSVRHLDNMRFGVGTARRGWCQAKDILNTKPTEEFLALLHRKG